MGRSSLLCIENQVKPSNGSLQYSDIVSHLGGLDWAERQDINLVNK